MATPGGTSHHQFPAVPAPAPNADSRIVPHEVLSGSPRPRNDSVVSERMAMATSRTVLAKMSGPTFGRMWRVGRGPVGAPGGPGPPPHRPGFSPSTRGRANLA